MGGSGGMATYRTSPPFSKSWKQFFQKSLSSSGIWPCLWANPSLAVSWYLRWSCHVKHLMLSGHRAIVLIVGSRLLTVWASASGMLTVEHSRIKTSWATSHRLRPRDDRRTRNAFSSFLLYFGALTNFWVLLSTPVIPGSIRREVAQFVLMVFILTVFFTCLYNFGAEIQSMSLHS